MDNTPSRDERWLRPRSVFPPAASAIDPAQAAAAAERASDRFAALAHELKNLLDGTMRYVALARHELRSAASARAGAGVSAHIAGLERDAERRLGVAQSALDRMAALVRAALSPGVGTLTERLFEPRPLIDAVVHACDVLRPMADEKRVRIDVDFSPRLVLSAAGPIYPVVANAIRNAIEAAMVNGRVEVVAELVTRDGNADFGAEVQIDVLDDGAGPPEDAGQNVFELGFTTKPTGLGIGLALSREIMRELGGTIALLARSAAPELNGHSGGAAGRGALLRIRYPLPAAASATI